MQSDKILVRLEKIEQKIQSQEIQALLSKVVLSFREACVYLDLSSSHLYKLTSQNKIPHYCPRGKRLYFNREELDEWMLRNRQATQEEIEKTAMDYIQKKK